MANQRQGDDQGDEADRATGCCSFILIGLSYIALVVFFPLSLCCAMKLVQEYERVVIFRLGRVLPGKAKGPGLFLVLPCVDEYRTVDLRTCSYDVKPQEILTKDGVSMKVDAVVLYRVIDAKTTGTYMTNVGASTGLLASTTLRKVLGKKLLSEILADRDSIASEIKKIIGKRISGWGVQLEKVEIKNVGIPKDMQIAMAVEARSSRDARAKAITADGELQASMNIREAANILNDSPGSLQLRFMQTLQAISSKNNKTIVFPLPNNILECFKRNVSKSPHTKLTRHK